MKYRILFSTFILLAAITLVTACSDDDESAGSFSVSNVADEPQWQVDWTFNQERPDWQSPEESNFDNWAIILVKLEEDLQPYVDPNDLMAIYVDGQIRGVASPAVLQDGSMSDGEFLIKAYGNDVDSGILWIGVRYYSSRLHHIFTLVSSIYYQPEQVYGIDEEFVPDLTLGAEKFPILMRVRPADVMNGTPIQPAEGDRIAAFVGDECRGVLTIDERLLSPAVELPVMGREEGEIVSFKYYEAATKRVYTFSQTMKMISNILQ